jgi:hypothetical protein
MTSARIIIGFRQNGRLFRQIKSEHGDELKLVLACSEIKPQFRYSMIAIFKKMPILFLLRISYGRYCAPILRTASICACGNRSGHRVVPWQRNEWLFAPCEPGNACDTTVNNHVNVI